MEKDTDATQTFDIKSHLKFYGGGGRCPCVFVSYYVSFRRFHPISVIIFFLRANAPKRGSLETIGAKPVHAKLKRPKQGREVLINVAQWRMLAQPCKLDFKQTQLFETTMLNFVPRCTLYSTNREIFTVKGSKLVLLKIFLFLQYSSLSSTLYGFLNLGVFLHEKIYQAFFISEGEIGNEI